MSAPTSARIAAERAAAATVALGGSTLDARLMAHVAGRGKNCWETDAQVRDEIERATGRKYHRESIGRTRRKLSERGILESVRIFMGTRPKGARFPTSHGTTEKRIVWKALGQRDPRGRAEQRRARDAQPQPHRVGPRYVALPPAVRTSDVHPSEARELAARAIAAILDVTESPSAAPVAADVPPTGADPPE